MLTFLNLDAINNEEGLHYVRTWAKSLNAILNWPEAQTFEWAEKWWDGLNDPDSFIFHEPPTYYILSLVIPEQLKQKFSSVELQLLRGRLLDSIQQKDSFCDRKPEFDWKLARQRIERVLAEYGEQLPET
jgi:hypothetical protein